MQDRPPKAVRLVVETRLGAGLSRKEIEQRLSRMMAELKLQDAELSVVLTGNDQIRELNRFYRKKDRPTDVLAFPMEECPPKNRTEVPRLLGDVIVSVPTARAQAVQAKRPAIDEVTMLLAHGVRHLLGWDHDTTAKDRAMRRETDRLCAVAQKPRKSASRRDQPRQRARRKLS